MKALYNFIVEPVGERYNNVKKIDGDTLLLNTRSEEHTSELQSRLHLVCRLLLEKKKKKKKSQTQTTTDNIDDVHRK